MPKIAVFATLTAKPGRGAELVEALSQLAEAVEGEPGTEIYVLHTLRDDPDKVMFYELYTDSDSFKAHGASEAMKAAGPELGELLAGPPEIVRATPERGKGISL